MWVLIGILIFVICVLGFVVWNLYSQNMQLESLVREMDVENSDIEQRCFNVYNFILSALSETMVELRRVDKIGAFESDDEVGMAFRSIMELISATKIQIASLNRNEPTNDGKSKDTK